MGSCQVVFQLCYCLGSQSRIYTSWKASLYAESRPLMLCNISIDTYAIGSAQLIALIPSRPDTSRLSTQVYMIPIYMYIYRSLDLLQSGYFIFLLPRSRRCFPKTFNMPGRLENKIAIVTGASAGIGRAICLAFHREGATVVCSSISENTRNEAFREEFTTHDLIVKEGGKAIFVKADVGKSEDMQALVKKTVETYGRLDIMVNNAGINFESHDRVPVPVWEVSEERWNKTMSINLNGTFLGCKYAMAQMVQQEPHTNGDRGWVINVSSMLGKVGAAYAGEFLAPTTPNQHRKQNLTSVIASYTTSKHAIMGLTKTAALEGAPHRVHVNALCPGCKWETKKKNLMKNDSRSSTDSK
ncbi:glucose 1-dehydrogenase, putative [Talaromyces marneffei ATCC 18224]|uniref:Glucose 1-dehydrogenase, putative n=1 Tax=Talaromyces marneffei (strain ATCC 18224 / CBS 334.59 / QM 7333) TaxID=441960 RepID=B6QFB0_TALMQ|nr:glucose 1-dehydrogenase, putative [Talaromyces marneffei ATCC 18224]